MPEVCPTFGKSDPLTMLCTNTSSWYALYVRSRAEKTVLAQLEAKSHPAFLPLYSKRHKWADRWKTVTLPLFPGYVFCQFSLAERQSAVTTSGVIDVVRRGREPAPIELAQLEAIRTAVNSKQATEPYEGLVEGERAILIDGPLKGLAGVVVEVRKNLRLVLSIELLRRSVLVEIERDWVTPVTPRSLTLEPELPAASMLGPGCPPERITQFSRWG